MRASTTLVIVLCALLGGCEYRVSGCDGPVCVTASSGVGQEGECDGCVSQCPTEDTVDRGFLREITLARRLTEACSGVAKPRFPNMTFDQTLDHAATGHALDMARFGFESVTGSDGLGVGERVAQVADAAYSLDNELAQLVVSGVNSPFDAVSYWLEGADDCALILSERFSHLGGACEEDDRGVTRWSLVLGGAGS